MTPGSRGELRAVSEPHLGLLDQPVRTSQEGPQEGSMSTNSSAQRRRSQAPALAPHGGPAQATAPLPLTPTHFPGHLSSLGQENPASPLHL